MTRALLRIVYLAGLTAAAFVISWGLIVVYSLASDSEPIEEEWMSVSPLLFAAQIVFFGGVAWALLGGMCWRRLRWVPLATLAAAFIPAATISVHAPAEHGFGRGGIETWMALAVAAVPIAALAGLVDARRR